MIIRLTISALIAIALAGCAAPALAKDMADDGTAAGHKIYVAKCAKCHKFYDPAKYSETDWEMWMGKMSKKAKLRPEQEIELSHYIDQNLRSPNGTNSGKLKMLKR